MATKKKAAPAKKIAVKKKSVKKAPPKASPEKGNFIDHFVSLEVADKMIAKGKEANLLSPMQFSIACIKEILAQKGVAFLRIYAAINDAGKQTYVLTGGSADHKRIDVVRKSKKNMGVITVESIGDMNIAQVCDPVKKLYS